MSLRRDITIYQALLHSENNHSRYKAFVYRDKKFSYKFLLKRVNQVAYSLNKLGYKKNDVISIMLPVIPESIYLLYAINQIGAIANLIHPLIKIKELRDIMIKTNSKLLFTLDMRYEEISILENDGINVYGVCPVNEFNFLIKNIYRKSNHLKKCKNDFSILLSDNVYFSYDEDYLADRFYLHSGGTTGEPKTIALSSFSLNSLAISGQQIVGVKDVHDNGMLSVLPIFHGFGLCMGIHTSLMVGAYNILMPKFSTKDCVHYLKKGLLTTIIGVPILYKALLNNKKFSGKKLKVLTNAFVGGDFVPPSLRETFNKHMIKYGSIARLYEGYGLTETVTVCTVNIHSSHRDGSVGYPIPYTKVKIFDNGKEVPSNTHGEIYVSGDTLMNGYRFEKVETDPFYIDEENVKWVKTGDYGKVDEDGFLYFVQRLKRIIKVNGINVFPSAIETLLSSLPYIYECHAMGVDDEKHGQLIQLYIVLNNEKKDLLDEENIKKLITDNFGVYALPKKIIYLDSLPKTLIGKVDEKKLKI